MSDFITNYLSPLEFQVAIKRLPSVEFFVQQVKIPGISASPINIPNPLNYVRLSNSKLEYDPFEVTFIIDENMTNFVAITQWMTGLSFPHDFNQYKNLEVSRDGLESDITLTILDSNKRPNISIEFVNCFPISLSPVILNTTNPDVIYPVATVAFECNYYKVINAVV